MDQARTPYLDALVRYASERNVPFHTPGHIQGRGAHQALLRTFGPRTLELDLCTGLDHLDGGPDSALGEAERLAAEAYGADESFFLVNGSTAGNHTMLVSTCHPGETVLVSRNTHKSIISALMVAGAVPRYVAAEIDPVTHLAHGTTPEAVDDGLTRAPDARAVVIVSPTYYGVCSDVAGIAEVCHRRGIPLLVDEAWGAHFPFHPALPEPALALGADAAVTSPHKLCGAFTQAALLNVRSGLIDTNRVRVVSRMVQSSSPSCLLYASLDVARMQMATVGEALLAETIAIADDARIALNEHPRLSVIDKGLVGHFGVHAVDPTRLCVDVTGNTGYEVERMLIALHRVVVEMSDFANVLCNVTIGHDAEDTQRLVRGLTHVASVVHGAGPEPEGLPEHLLTDVPEQALSPSDAFHAAQERVPLAESVGRVSAEMVASYPPGIPALIPGERLTRPMVEYLSAQVQAGCRLVGPEDPFLETILVVTAR